MAQGAYQKGDVDEWIGRAKEALNNPKVITDAAPSDYAPWHERLFGCFAPIDTCFITWCCPCITFGKTHHRLRKDGNMAGYSAVNTSCLLWCGVAMIGCHCIPNMLQRHDIRSRYHLQGDGPTDCLRAWCCNCCDLIQQDKEADYHRVNGTQMHDVIAHQPEKQNNMAYGNPAPPQQQMQDPAAGYPPAQYSADAQQGQYAAGAPPPAQYSAGAPPPAQQY